MYTVARVTSYDLHCSPPAFHADDGYAFSTISLTSELILAVPSLLQNTKLFPALLCDVPFLVVTSYAQGDTRGMICVVV